MNVPLQGINFLSNEAYCLINQSLAELYGAPTLLDLRLCSDSPIEPFTIATHIKTTQIWSSL